MTGVKQKLIWAVCLILLFIPTYIGVWAFTSAQKKPVTDNAVTRMELTDLVGTSYSIERGTVSDGFEGGVLAFFMGLNSASKPVGELPKQLEGTGNFKAVYYSYDLSTAYRYYFSADPENAYYVDAENNAYKIPADKASIFIQSSYGVCIYPTSTPPSLTFGQNGAPILPSSMKWQSLSYGNAYKTVDAPVAAGTERPAITVRGGLDMHFTVNPDYLLVNIKRDGETVYDDMYENLAAFTFEEGNSLSVTLTAKWYEDEQRGAFGEAVYIFDVSVQPAPVFYLGATSIQPGEFVVLSGKNVTDTSSIGFSSEPAINYTPVFYRDGDYVRALVPISVELPDTPSYTFTLTCGGVTQTTTLSIEKKQFKSKDIDVSSQALADKFSAAAQKELADGIMPLLAAPDETLYWSGKFSEGVPGRYITAGFGINRKLTGKFGNGTTYRNPGVDYIVNAGDKVVAANAGKVIFVGEFTLTGKTVIIEHGLGLKSLYAYLGDISVKVGDTVKTGDSIGTVGRTDSGYAFQYRLYAGGVPVCPYTLWEKGIPMTQ